MTDSETIPATATADLSITVAQATTTNSSGPPPSVAMVSGHLHCDEPR